MCVLVPDNTGHLSHNIPPFGTWGILNFDFTISPYTAIPFENLFSLFYSTGLSAEWDTPVTSTPPPIGC